MEHVEPFKTDMLQLPERSLAILLGAADKTLASPDNVARWKINPEAACGLCGQPKATLTHILVGCYVALVRDRRYTWRHDLVVMDMTRALRVHVEKLNERKPTVASPHHTAFVKAGAVVPPKRKKEATGILSKANDWIIVSDIKRRDASGAIVDQPYPDFIAATGLERPDIILFSYSTKTVVLIENTCPDEQNVIQAYTRKTKRYSEPRSRGGKSHASIVTKLEAMGWKVHLFPVEVCARGHVAFSVRRCMRALGFENKEYNELQRTLEQTAIYSLTVIWNSRDNSVWCPARTTVWPQEDMPPLEVVPRRAKPPPEARERKERKPERVAIPPPPAAKMEPEPYDDLPPGIVPRGTAAASKNEPGVNPDKQEADFEAMFADELELDLSF